MQKTGVERESQPSHVGVRQVCSGDSIHPTSASHPSEPATRLKCLHKEYYLVAMSSQTDDGRFQARCAAMVLSDARTRSQRFLDFETFNSRLEADTFAIEAGKAWIDQQLREPSGRSPTNYASF